MGCAGIPEIDLSQWNVLKSLNGQRYPYNGMIELTDRCNLNCVHCYINQPAASREALATEMSTAQVKHVLDQMVEAGTLFLTITGGEPLLRKDFSEIYMYAKRKGFIITLFTNATMVTPEIADMLAEWKPLSIEVSLYGATQETYERVTRVPGSYARFKRGVKLLMEHNIPVSLKSVLLTENHHELTAMQALTEELGTTYRYDGVIWPRLDGSLEPFEHQLPVEVLTAIDYRQPERGEERKQLAELHKGEIVRADYIYNCGAGLTSFHITSAGKMCICGMARRPAFDLKEMPFMEAWEKIGELRQLKRQMDTKCRTCEIGAYCVQCAGWSQLVHNDDETPVEFICELAHAFASQP